MRSKLVGIYRLIERYVVGRMENPFFRFVAVSLTLVDLRREATAAAWGKSMTFRGESRASLTALRRNVHRLEKGLIMRPRRVPFGRDYLSSTVSELARLQSAGSLPEPDGLWARDVLDAYFAATAEESTAWLDDARSAFGWTSPTDVPSKRVPYPRGLPAPASVTINDLEALAQRRRSVRWFDDAPVDPAMVDRALTVGGLAPSACNRQNVRLALFHGVAKCQSILDTAGGTRGFAHQVPCVAVLVGRLSGYRHTFDRHAIYIDGGLMSMGLLFGLEAQGLSSCCINWPDVQAQDRKIRRLVEMDADEQVLMLIAIGHADAEGQVPYSQKRSIDSLRSWS